MHAFPRLWRKASRVMPQSPHETENQKRGLAHGGRKETPLFSLPPSLLSSSIPPKCWQDGPTEDETVYHLPWKRLFLSLCLSPSLSVSHCLSLHLSFTLPTLHAAAGVSSSFLSSLVLVFSLSIPSSLRSVNLPLASLMSGLPGCLLHGSRLCAFQALWQCFPQAPLVPPHTANSHAAHRRMKEGEEWRGGLQRRGEREGVWWGGCTGWDWWERTWARVAGQERKKSGEGIKGDWGGGKRGNYQKRSIGQC